MNKIILTLGLHSSSIRIFTLQTQSILLNPNHSWQSCSPTWHGSCSLWNCSLHCYREKLPGTIIISCCPDNPTKQNQGSLYYSRTARITWPPWTAPDSSRAAGHCNKQDQHSKIHMLAYTPYMICTLCMRMYAYTQPHFPHTHALCHINIGMRFHAKTCQVFFSAERLKNTWVFFSLNVL